MRKAILIVVLVVLGISPVRSNAQKYKISAESPRSFEIGTDTFFDFGPPFHYYEILIVRPAPEGSQVERILLTPPGDKCFAPAKVEVATATINKSAAELFGKTNPCSIPEKELNRELKRCKNCLVFSGSNVVMQVQCGDRTRMIRSDILDKDMFDPNAVTPEHSSWTMGLLSQLEKPLGPGVMDKPMFALPTADAVPFKPEESPSIQALTDGHFDALFKTEEKDKPSTLYHLAQLAIPVPTVKLRDSSPFKPETFVAPAYPPLAKVTHQQGVVTFSLDVEPDGTAANLVYVSGPPLFQGTTQEAMKGWRFPEEAALQHVMVEIEFKLCCLD